MSHSNNKVRLIPAASDPEVKSKLRASVETVQPTIKTFNRHFYLQRATNSEGNEPGTSRITSER